MAEILQFDEQASRRLEAVYMTPDVVAQRGEVLAALALRPGERVADIGSGPGFLAAAMADAVGPGGAVWGIDLSASMLALAQERCAGRPWVAWAQGDATSLPLPDGSVDAAVSTQVYEYVGDVPTALGELRRILRPGGRALILDTDWDSIVWHAADRPRMERILAAWNDHLVHPHLPATLTPLCRDAGLRVRHRAVIPLFNPEYDAATYSHGMSGLIAAFVTGRHGLTADDVAAWMADLQALGAAHAYFFSLNRYLFLVEKPAPPA